MKEHPYPKARTSDLVVQTLEYEILVYDLTLNTAHCLNETAAFVWANCIGELSVDDIASLASVRFNGQIQEQLVRLAITQFADRKLLVENDLAKETQISRRSALRSIGLTSLLAVPVIASIATPANAFGALSCRIACTSNAQCLEFPSCGNFCDETGVCAPSPVT